MSITAEIDRGRQAEELAAHPLFREAVDGLRDQLMREWVESPARDTEGREKLWLAQSLLRRIEAHLKSTMETGRMARMQLEQERSLARRALAAMTDRWA